MSQRFPLINLITLLSGPMVNSQPWQLILPYGTSVVWGIGVSFYYVFVKIRRQHECFQKVRRRYNVNRIAIEFTNVKLVIVYEWLQKYREFYI